MNLTRGSKLLVGYYVLIVIWWLLFYILQIKETTANYLYQFAFGLIPIAGGIMGIKKSHQWGSLRSHIGAALFYISTGLIAWGIGQMFWSIYYNLILAVEIPYPSLADVGYILAVPLWVMGMVHLSKATGVKFSLKKMEGKIMMLLIPVIFVIFSYYLLVTLARGGVISDLTGGYAKIFFDFAYPLGDVVILTMAAIIYGLSFNYLGGRYKASIITVLLGFIVMYIVDFSFSYVTTAGTYFNGHWVDVLFPTALMLMAIGVNNFDTKN